MSGRQGVPSANSMVLNRIQTNGHTYELRQNRCGKRRCSVCYGTKALAAGRPGHGPYWYLVLQTARGVRRIYIGKALDTGRYIMPDGSIAAEAFHRGIATHAKPQQPAANPKGSSDVNT